jgi:hypothetical protein
MSLHSGNPHKVKGYGLIMIWALIATSGGTLVVLGLSLAVTFFNFKVIGELQLRQHPARTVALVNAGSHDSISVDPGPEATAEWGVGTWVASNLVATQAWLATLLAFSGAVVAALFELKNRSEEHEKKYNEKLRRLEKLGKEYFRDVNATFSQEDEMGSAERAAANEKCRKSKTDVVNGLEALKEEIGILDPRAKEIQQLIESVKHFDEKIKSLGAGKIAKDIVDDMHSEWKRAVQPKGK